MAEPAAAPGMAEPAAASAKPHKPMTNMEDYYENNPYPWTGSWKDKLGELAGKPGICQTVPDYVTAHPNRMQKSRHSTLRQIAEPYMFPVGYGEMDDLSRIKWKFENCKDCFSISGPQLGISRRAIFWYKPRKLRKMKLKDKFPVYHLLNPSYEPIDDEFDLDYEKCPSVPGLCGLVNRYWNIRYQGFNFDGELIKGEESGFIARWLQHEIDHLNGILFTDQAVHIMTIKEHRERREVGRLQFVLDVK